MTVLIFVLLIQGSALFLCISRFGLLPLPAFFLAYAMLAEISLYSVKEGLIEFPFLMTWTHGGFVSFYEETVVSYACISMLFVIFFAVPRSPIISQMWSASNESSIDLIASAFSRVSGFFIMLLAGQLVVLAVSLNWDVVWRNSSYLTMTAPRIVVGDNAFLQALFGSIGFVGMAAGAMGALCIIIGQRLYGACYLTVSLFYFAFYFGAHSRVAALIPAAIAAVLLLLDFRKYKAPIICLGFIVLITITNALTGRSSGLHGISTIPDFLDNLVDPKNNWKVTDLVTNISEGIFTFAEGLTVGFRHLELYKLLSFSPLPSFIDGFASLRLSGEVRLSAYVPISGYTEAYLFGVPWMIALLSLFYVSIRLNVATSYHSPISFLLGNVLLLLSAYLLQTYPLRNGLKPLWIADLVSIISLVSSSKRHSSRRWHSSLRR